MQHVMICLAVVALSAPLPAEAQEETLTPDADTAQGQSGIVSGGDLGKLMRAEYIIGSDFYTMNASMIDWATEWEWNDARFYDQVDERWERIGEVDDIVLSRDGRLVGVIVEVGGWLDIGDSEVLLDMADVRAVGGGADYDYEREMDFVTSLSKEQIGNMDPVDGSWWQ